MEPTKKAPALAEKPIIQFQRRYVEEGNKRYHVINFEYGGETYESRKLVPHGEETLPSKDVYRQLKTGANNFQRILKRVFQNR